MNNSKTSNLTIVMYHYIRDAEATDFPKIHALGVGEFCRQIEKLLVTYHIVSPEQVADYILGDEPLPENSCVLSFDDGLKDHYINAFPLLVRYNISGWFFPITSTLDGVVADVNKLQFILAKLDTKTIVNEFHNFTNEYAPESKIDFSIDDKVKKDARYRFDDVLTANLKTTIQIMPNDLRARFLYNMFTKFIGNEKKFSHDLYLSIKEIKEMSKMGQVFGSHTHTHPRLDQLSLPKQEEELAYSSETIKSILGKAPKTLSYPYGRYNKITLELLSRLGYNLCLGTEVGVNNGIFNRWSLKRINANDI